jgi:ABC-2 type transport system ATP-binding protein
MAESFIEVHNLIKSYGAFKALQGLSFEVGRGEFFGLLGPNGAGKTTTIGLLTGLLQPTEGTILIEGSNLSLRPRKYKARLGLVPQDFAFYPSLSARDNLRFFGRLYGLWGRLLQQRIQSALEAVQLPERDGQAVKTFSNGMKRRLNIAIALLHQPEILILDEPTVGVDAQSRNAILETIQMLNRNGTTVLYTTHLMEEAERFCHRVAILDQGKIMALDTPQALVNRLGGGMIRVVFDRAIDNTLQGQLALLGSFHLSYDQEVTIDLDGGNKLVVLKKLLDLNQGGNRKIKSLNLIDSNLETVFLRLTGKQLRD